MRKKQKQKTLIKHSVSCEACGCGMYILQQQITRIRNMYGGLLCVTCRKDIDFYEPAQELTVELPLHDPYPHVFVQGANDQECAGLIIGLG